MKLNAAVTSLLVVAAWLQPPSAMAFMVPQYGNNPQLRNNHPPTLTRTRSMVKEPWMRRYDVGSTQNAMTTTTTTTCTSLSAVPPMVQSTFQLASSTVNSIKSNPLFTYFMEKLIDTTVVALIGLGVVFGVIRIIKSMKGKDEKEEELMETNNAISELYNDLYGSTKNGGILNNRRRGGWGGPFNNVNNQPPLPKNLGVPQKEYLKITNINEKFDAYDFSIVKSTQSKAKAAAQFRSKSFQRALGRALNAEVDEADDDSSTNTFIKSSKVRAKLLEAEKEFLKKGRNIVQKLQNAEAKLAANAIDTILVELSNKEGKDTNNENVIDAEVVMDTNITATATSTSNITTTSTVVNRLPSKPELTKQIMTLQTELQALELEFIQKVMAAVGTKRAVGLRNALLGDIQVRGTGQLLSQLQERPLSSLLKVTSDMHDTVDNNNSDSDATSSGTRVNHNSLYVMNFPGDVQASQLNELREEVTAIIRNAQPGDEALVVLQSGGGTVTGYGLAAGQLLRLKEKGLRLTIAVEQVAASGGYMMSCVADKIVASPFAVLGSIGVISEIPNVYERLKAEGIEFQTVTAGKFKRTLTPTKKVTKEDMKKSEEDIEQIFQLFKGWVGQNRPQLNIDEISTGEVWFGRDALDKGLCDEIKTVDDVLLEYVDSGFTVYQVKYDPPPEVPESLSFLFASKNGDGPRMGEDYDASLVRRAIRWLIRSFVNEVQSIVSETSPETSVEKRYMAKDETADRVKVFDEYL